MQAYIIYYKVSLFIAQNNEYNLSLCFFHLILLGDLLLRVREGSEEQLWNPGI